jgi:hypothetical protein
VSSIKSIPLWGEEKSEGDIAFSVEPKCNNAKRTLIDLLTVNRRTTTALLYSVSINLSSILLDQLGLLGRPRGLARAWYSLTAFSVVTQFLPTLIPHMSP